MPAQMPSLSYTYTGNAEWYDEKKTILKLKTSGVLTLTKDCIADVFCVGGGGGGNGSNSTSKIIITTLEAEEVVVILKLSELVLQNKRNTKQSLEPEVLVLQRTLLAAKAGRHQ